MKLVPVLDRVILKETEWETQTASGLILSASNETQPKLYEVISCGPGMEGIEMWTKPGDKVILCNYAGTPVTIDGEKFSIVRLADILSIVE